MSNLTSVWDGRGGEAGELCLTFNFYFWARQDDEFIVWSMPRATSPCLLQLPQQNRGYLCKKLEFPSTACVSEGNPRSWMRPVFQLLPTQDRSGWEPNKWAFLYLRGDFFFFLTMCQQKICRQSCYTFHTADFISVRALMTHLHLLVHLGLFLWLPRSEEAYKSWPVWQWSTLPMEFWWASQQWRGGRESASGLSYRNVEFCS